MQVSSFKIEGRCFFSGERAFPSLNVKAQHSAQSKTDDGVRWWRAEDAVNVPRACVGGEQLVGGPILELRFVSINAL